MGDLGSDAGSSALSLGAKALEAILRLFEKIFEAWRNNPERELAKYRLKETKNEISRQKILERLDGKTGWVNYQDLKRSGQELESIGVFMTKEEMKEFSALCKRERIQFSGMTDSTEKNEDGVKTYELICKKSDLEKILRVVDRLNDEKMLIGIDNRIAELEAKGENMTPQDKVDIENLREQKAAIQKGYCEKLNNEMSKNVIDRAVTGEVKQNLTLDEALNRLTGRHIDKDIVCIVADANDPSKYIKCHGYQDVYKDEAYIKTDYEVYRDGQSVLKTHDGRFDNRPKDYWDKQKAAIQKAGDFSGTFFKFYSVVEYQKWAENVRNQNAQELNSMDKEGDKNFDIIIKDLESQLDNNGAKMQDGIVVDKETGEPLAITEGMTEEQQAMIAEAIVIGKQINNYTEISRLDGELAVAKADILVTKEGTEERLTAEANLSKIQGQYDIALGKEKELLTERKSINAVQAEQEVRKNPELSKTQDIEFLPEDKSKIEALEAEIEVLEAKIEEYSTSNPPVHTAVALTADGKTSYKNVVPTSKEIEQLKANLEKLKGDLETLKAQAVKNAQKSNGKKDDRLNEKDAKQMSMQEAKIQIESDREKDATKGRDVKDGHLQEKGAKSAVSKTSMNHSER